ncbi:hypothetical protein [Mitsuaria sp. GD03876]|uniref:acyltransferase n=1 Tax=Mitsuaria sp. GD03876 TaxID=2975399 RepID=UPI0024480A5D|nr:hypothetical protein [Mitsuaria sp. GD03876]MDH0863271.1 hypothetical protein [Mitsuaria sp. GD03876]
MRKSGEGEVIVGRHTRISDEAEIIFAKPGRLTIGDYCVIGPGVRFICAGGDIEIDDWTTLHDRCLVMSGQGVKVGQHGWFGQNAILDGTGGLTIGNGVRVGMYSQIWSHVAAGEQIEGCTLYGERPVVIEDDVWLVGSCIVASGVTIGARTVALIGSNITKSWPEKMVIAGSPAAAKSLSFYKDLELDDKFRMLQGWVDEILPTIPGCVRLEAPEPDEQVLLADSAGEAPSFIFAKRTATADELRARFPEATVCCIEDKRYEKKFTRLEPLILKPLAGNKARFLRR